MMFKIQSFLDNTSSSMKAFHDWMIDSTQLLSLVITKQWHSKTTRNKEQWANNSNEQETRTAMTTKEQPTSNKQQASNHNKNNQLTSNTQEHKTNNNDQQQQQTNNNQQLTTNSQQLTTNNKNNKCNDVKRVSDDNQQWLTSNNLTPPHWWETMNSTKQKHNATLNWAMKKRTLHHCFKFWMTCFSHPFCWFQLSKIHKIDNLHWHFDPSSMESHEFNKTKTQCHTQMDNEEKICSPLF